MQGHTRPYESRFSDPRLQIPLLEWLRIQAYTILEMREKSAA
jgi:hypothetical protein